MGNILNIKNENYIKNSHNQDIEKMYNDFICNFNDIVLDIFNEYKGKKIFLSSGFVDKQYLFSVFLDDFFINELQVED